jgi:protein dispatched 1
VISKEKSDDSRSFIEILFHDYWNKWMYKARWFILAIVAAWFGIAIWRSTNFKPATEALKMLDDDHELSILQDSLRYDYHTGEYDNTIQVNFIWGIEDVDKSGVNRWDASNLGTIEWDNNFDMSSEANQQRLLDICNNLKASNLVKDQQVTCWVQDFVNAQNGGNPVPQANFYTELETYLATTTGQNQYSDNQIGYINGRLYFIKFEALSVAIPFQGYEILEPVYDDWENLKDNYNKNSPIGINNSFQTAAFHWAFLVTEKAFVSGAIQGTLISMLFAFLVLLFSTLNIMIALYSILSIGGIVVSAISVMEMSGWTLGIIESIAMVILIGFSVDYVVHLANHYVESVYEDRYRKMQESLGSIGISILSGAITTFG